MAELTFENKGTPIAKVIGREGANKIIYLFDKRANEEQNRNKPKKKNIKLCCKRCKGGKCTFKCCKQCCNDNDVDLDDETINLLNDRYFNKLGGRKSSILQIEKFKNSISSGDKRNIDKNMYQEIANFVNNEKGKEIIIYDGDIQPLPNPNSRECLYVCGPSGSGKSTFISHYITEFKKIHPTYDVILFSRVDHDPVLDKHKPIRILMDNKLINNPINPDELTDSLVIFDDTDTIPQKPLKDAITNLKDSLLEIGRHENVYVAITSHLINNYKETRKVLNECHSLTIFPGGGAAHSIKYALKTFFGLDNEEIRKIMKLPSRWVTVRKLYPQLVMYNKGIYLLSRDNV
jgi:hypothetical protein